MFNNKLKDLLVWLLCLSADGHTPKIVLALMATASIVAYGTAIFNPESQSASLVAQSLLAISVLLGGLILCDRIKNKRMIWDRPDIRPTLWG